MKPSPIVLTIRPLFSARSGSMVVARTSFRAARVELSSASILPEYPTTSAASMAASLRTVRSIALSLATAPSLLPDPTPISVSYSARFGFAAKLGPQLRAFCVHRERPGRRRGRVETERTFQMSRASRYSPANQQVVPAARWANPASGANWFDPRIFWTVRET